MERMTPEGLKQSPSKINTNRKLEKVDEGSTPVSMVSVNWFDAIRLFFGKKIENKAFEEYQISIGKVAAVTVGGGGGIFSLASINWALLLSGNPIEIIKLILGIIGIVAAWFWKK